MISMNSHVDDWFGIAILGKKNWQQVNSNKGQVISEYEPSRYGIEEGGIILIQS